jgi:hypothetical protein
MNQRFLMWGLTSIAFVVTLAISSWHEGLWPSDEPVIARGANRPVALVPAEGDSTALPDRPFAPENPAPVTATPPVAMATPQPQPAQPAETPAPATETTPALPTAEAEVDTAQFLAHRDRAWQHSSRAR